MSSPRVHTVCHVEAATGEKWSYVKQWIYEHVDDKWRTAWRND